MSRNFTYILVVICLFVAFTLPNLLHPEHTLMFIVEELIGVCILSLGFFIFKKNINKVVVNFNQKYPWAENIRKRLLASIGLITLYSVLFSSFLLGFGWLFFEAYGEPEFFRIMELELQAQFEKFPQRHQNRNFIVKEFSIFHYTASIVGGCFFMFLTIFFVEESYEYNQLRYHQRISNEQAAKEQALSKINALQNQLNPHFMFNALNVLSGLMYEDLDKANQFIKKLSEIYRYVLVQSEEIVATVAKELEFANAYIFLLKIRFEDQLKISIDVDEQRLDWLLPSLTLELLIENTIKHNSLDANAPLEIVIKVAANNLIVKNNYRPRIDQGMSNGIGIKNLQERLSLLGLKGASFEINKDQYIATIPLLNPNI